MVLRVLLSCVRGVVGGRWGSCVRGLGGVAAGWRPWCVSAGVCRGGGVLVRGGRWGLVVSWLAVVSAVLYGTYSYVLCLMFAALSLLVWIMSTHSEWCILCGTCI